MKKISFFLVIAAFALTLTACNQAKKPAITMDEKGGGSTTATDKKNDDGGKSEVKSDDSKTSDTKDEKDDASATDDTASTAKKLNYYVDCINRHSERVSSSYDRYLSWVDAKNGPTGKEQIIYGLYDIYETKECLDGLKEAKSATPTMVALEKAGEAYAAALTKVEPLIAEANDYYEQSNYKDDKMAKGKTMHVPLIQAWGEFEKADKAMRAEVDVIDDELSVKELAVLEKEQGRKIPFLKKTAMLLAKKIIKLGNVGDLNKIKLDEFTKSIEDYDKALTELNTYMTAHKDEADEYTMIDLFISQSKDYLTSAKELMRRVRDKEPYSTGDKMNLGGPGEWMVDGSPGKLLRNYNTLIDTSNDL